MSNQQNENKSFALEAQRLNAMLNTLSLFTRKTLLDWLPELESRMGITGERFMVLFELHLQPDRSLKELAHTLVVSPSSLSVMINSLVEQGLVSRVTDPADRRRVVLRLSRQGEERFSEAESHVMERFQQFLLRMDQQDRHELNDATDKMLQVMDRILKQWPSESEGNG